MPLSLTPFLVAVELDFVLVLARRCSRTFPQCGVMSAIYLYLARFTVYALATSALGVHGLYVRNDVLP